MGARVLAMAVVSEVAFPAFACPAVCYIFPSVRGAMIANAAEHATP